MTPKEKAIELYEKMDIDSGSWNMNAIQSKECALVCVNEIIENIKSVTDGQFYSVMHYWEEVKKEIEIL